MVMSCAAFNCKNRFQKNCGLSFHRFPKDPELRKQWAIATKRKNFVPTDVSALCSKHFLESDYEIGGLIRKLKPFVVPSIFEFPANLHLETNAPKRRRVLFQHEIQEKHSKNKNENAEIELKNKNSINSSLPNEEECMMLSSHGSPTKTSTLKKGNEISSPTKILLRRKIKVLQQRLKRRDKKIRTMGDIIILLKKKLNCPQRLLDLLEENFSGFPLELIVSTLKNKKSSNAKKQYSEKMKEFSLTLYFYSPKAFKYLKNIGFCLPNPSTIRRWLSKFNCSPVLLGEVFDYLKQNISTNPSLKNVSLVFDCISIRKQIIFDHNEGKNYGYVDLGSINIENQEELATEALVFQVVSLQKSFKCVVAYFLINNLHSSVLSQLIKTVITKLNEVGITVHNLTCDGPSNHLSALKNLGCELPNKPWFILPTITKKIFVTLDPCHMLKLSRNTLADMGDIQSADGVISFKYLALLNKVQKQEGYTLCNKLSDKHIDYKNRKMKVKIAAQTLSSGVADALDFLKTKDPRFLGCEATIKFIRTIDRLFDILNSRDPYGKNFKEPMKSSNKSFNYKFLDETKDYLSKLKIKDVSILKHPRKTFVLGFLSDINSLKALTTRLIEEEKFQYFLTYKLSQDHIELFFSCIRSMGGHNNNPNVLQFKWALRKLMFKNSVRCSDGSNCIEFDPHVQASILSSTVAQNTATTKVETENYNSTIFSQNFFENDTVSYYQQNVLYYIAGYIASKLTSKVECETCCQLLVNTTNSKLMFCSDFLNNVNMGKLFYPSNDLFKVVCYFHKMLKLYTDQMNTFNMNKCIVAAMNHFSGTVFREHSELVEIAEETHELKLIKMIGYLYFKIKCHDLAKKKTQILNTGSKGLRQKLNKIILFNHT